MGEIINPLAILFDLMYAERDYENCFGCDCCSGDRCDALWRGRCERIHVAIEACNGYSMVSVKCRDRPKLLFDTVCALKELQFVVFHAVAGARGSTAEQEYFIRKKNGCTLETEGQRERLRHCLVAAISRRASRGFKLDVRTKNKMGLLSDVTRTVRKRFVDNESRDEYSRELRGVVVSAVKTVGMVSTRLGSSSDVEEENRAKSSIGRLLWSKLERLSTSIRR
ncbi:hypothetical protein Bca52824_040292 [Brassica carinata]|uniref:ACT domain-containing protein ACR n=1 Tax=Brassica carinata TaxID=52824 RepID=A0A8X7RT63_BRACI|nr:hypothetical protein Bca52824_040292 [Brassica carinata]